MNLETGQVVTLVFTTHASDDSLADADALPTGTLYVDGVADAAVVAVTNISTGIYRAAVTMPTIADGQSVALFIAATLGGVTTGAKIFEEVVTDALAVDLSGYSSGSAGAALGYITSGGVNVIYHMKGVDVESHKGAAYNAANGLAFDFTKTEGETWPADLTGMTPTIVIGDPDDTEFTGSVETATGSSQKVRFELTSAQSSAIDTSGQGGWPYTLWVVVSATERYILRRGRWVSVEEGLPS